MALDSVVREGFPMKGVYRAKPTKDFEELGIKESEFVIGFLNRCANQYFILGQLVEVDVEYCHPEFWVPVKKDTICPYVGKVDGQDIFVGDILFHRTTHYLIEGEYSFYCRPVDFLGIAYPIEHAKGKLVGNKFDNKGIIERWL